MFFLPSLIRRYYEDEAEKKGLNVGSLCLQILCQNAIEKGHIRCNHSSNTVLYAKEHVDNHGWHRAEWKCKSCGVIFEK